MRSKGCKNTFAGLLSDKGAVIGIDVFEGKAVGGLLGDGPVVVDMLPHFTVKVDLELVHLGGPVETGSFAFLYIVGHVPSLAVAVGIETPIFGSDVGSTPFTNQKRAVDGDRFDFFRAGSEKESPRSKQQEKDSFCIHQLSITYMSR